MKNLATNLTTTVLDTRLIGLVGYAGSGKDTVAGILGQLYGFKQFSLASTIKDIIAVGFNIPVEVQNHPVMKNHQIPELGVSPRELAQFIGTEVFRAHFGEDIWIQLLTRKINNPPAPQMAVISDVRFQNELDWIYDNDGYIIHISRPGYNGNVGIAGHASEALQELAYNAHKTHIVVNDSGIPELRNEIRRIADLIGIV